jgi:fructan beta-fructosidase
MVVWSDEGVNVYSSPDLRDWTFRGRFAADWLFECPDLVALPVDGDPVRTKWVLSDASGEHVVGDFDGAAFRTDWPGPQRMDHGHNDPGGSFYAARVFSGTPQGQVVRMAWMPGNRGATWTGSATFPWCWVCAAHRRVSASPGSRSRPWKVCATARPPSATAS